jgi:hypothetical protein
MATHAGSFDDVGPKERGWVCAGYLVAEGVAGLPVPPGADKPAPRVLAPDDQPPILFLPAGWPAADRELAFGWARSELAEHTLGWLGALRHLIALGKVAATAGLGARIADLNGNGIPDVIGHLLRLCRHVGLG